MKVYQNIFFDLDGTLIASGSGIIRCIEYAMRKIGDISSKEDDLLWCIGPPLRESFAKLLHTSDPLLIEKALGYFRERYAATGLLENALYPGIDTMLSILRRSGHRLFVATETDKQFTDRILKRFSLRHYFTEVYGPPSDGTRDDKTKLLRFVLDEQRIDGGSALMVGDRKYDIVAALNNEIDALGVTYGYGTSTELLAAGASALCSLPSGVVEWIGGVG